jgi:hypothetical protein
MTTSYNHFPKIASALETALGQVVRKTAFDGQANVQAQIRANGQIDTSFMINSVYTVTDQGSTYQGGDKAFPEVGPLPEKFSAFLAVAANYAGYQNYGTTRITARPFWEPGIEKTQQGFDQALAAIDGTLKGSIL